MREIGRVGEVAEGREAVLAHRGRSRGCEEEKGESGTAGGRPQGRGPCHQSCDEPGSRAASVWSNHQT
jgi:hypothetical protein